MFVFKKKYFLIIESIKDLELKNIKKRHKFCIIYRNNKISENKVDILNFRKACRLKAIKFFVANNNKLAVSLNADGVYLSSYNKSFKALSQRKPHFQIIGSAHNLKEITMKIRQGCSLILLSKLFRVNYDKTSPYLGVIKFNNKLKINRNLIPLGGINLKTLNKIKNINCKGFAMLSEIKKKPANIINRLF
jgi:thiamine-phosphate pyrophosphorylase